MKKALKLKEIVPKKKKNNNSDSKLQYWIKLIQQNKNIKTKKTVLDLEPLWPLQLLCKIAQYIIFYHQL